MTVEEKIKQILLKNKLAAISTVGKDKPESGLIAFVENDKLEIYFQTSTKTRKYRNLASNNSVSLVIGFDLVNLQYEGKAHEIRNQDEIDKIKDLFEKKKSPTTRYYLERPDTAVFKIKPTWIGYRNYEMHPPEFLEMKF